MLPFIPTLPAANIYTETLLTQLWSLYDNTCTIGTKEQYRNINDIWNLWNVFYLIIHRNIFLCQLFYDKMTKRTMSLKLKKTREKIGFITRRWCGKLKDIISCFMISLVKLIKGKDLFLEGLYLKHISRSASSN